MKFFIALVLFTTFICQANAKENKKTCYGNIETYSKEIVQAGISYKLSYEIFDSKVKIRFAGHEFDAIVENGNSWKGLWITKMDNDIYFSYLPDDGGTIKFKFKENLWYSGNC
jgi:hypothetical protein